MRKIKQLEQKIEEISNAIGIQYWNEEVKICEGSPPAYFDRKTYRAYYHDLPVKQAIDLILDYLKVEIKKSSELYPPYTIVKKGNKLIK